MKKKICGIVLALAAVSAVGSDDPTLTIACGVVFALAIGLLWRVGEPPILLLPVGVQLIQVVTPRLYANWAGVPLLGVTPMGVDTTAATWFALAAMASLAVGMRCAQFGMNASTALALHRDANAWPPRSAFVLCVASVVVGAAFDVLGGLSEGLRQPALAIGGIQWMGLFVLGCVTMTQGRGIGYFVAVTGLEIVKGFSGYFGDFRLVLYVLLIVAFSTRLKIRLGNVIGGLAIGGTLLLMGIWWSAIKTEYRDFISGGSFEQIVVVPFSTRIEYLFDRLAQTDGEMMSDGLARLVQRVGYVEYLAATMQYVPSNVPFQYGRQLGLSVLNVLEPRLLFPDKPAIPSDSEVLEKYTGIHFGLASSEGTSVALGYLAELYVDFGPFGAVVVTFIMGFLFGRAIRYVISSKSLPAIVNYGLAMSLVMLLTQFELALIKMIGGFVTALASVALLQFLLPYMLTMLGLPYQRKVLVRAAE